MTGNIHIPEHNKLYQDLKYVKYYKNKLNKNWQYTFRSDILYKFIFPYLY